MSKKARNLKKLRRRMRAEWLKSFAQRDLEITFSDLICYGVSGIAEENGIVRRMTPEEIYNILKERPVINSRISYDVLMERFLK